MLVKERCVNSATVVTVCVLNVILARSKNHIIFFSTRRRLNVSTDLCANMCACIITWFQMVPHRSVVRVELYALVHWERCSVCFSQHQRGANESALLV